MKNEACILHCPNCDQVVLFDPHETDDEARERIKERRHQKTVLWSV